MGKATEEQDPKAKAIDSAWHQHMAAYHGMERRHGSFRRSVRHSHQAMDNPPLAPDFALHETLQYQSKKWVRGQMNDNGTPLMREEAVRYMNQSFNADRLRDWLTPREVAIVLAVSNDVVYRILRKCALKCYRPSGVDGNVRIKVAALQTFMETSDYTADEIAEAVARARILVSAQQTQQTQISPILQQTP